MNITKISFLKAVISFLEKEKEHWLDLSELHRDSNIRLEEDFIKNAIAELEQIVLCYERSVKKYDPPEKQMVHLGHVFGPFGFKVR